MGQLRKTIQRQIIDSLDSSYFTSDDFVVSFESDTAETLCTIVFIHESTFFYHIEKHSTNFYARVSPGNFNINELHRKADFQAAVEDIPLWCAEVRNELKASKPIYKEVDELREIIEQHIIGESSEDDEFSVEEINELHKKFNELNARVEVLEEQQIITPKQKEQFTSGVTQVSEDLEYYPKKTWIKTSSSKLVKLVTNIGKSQEGRKLLESGARKLLGLD